METKNMTSGISEAERKTLIARMVEELPVLRTKLGLSQEELAGMIDVSRQTYSSIENQRRSMSWSTYLSLVLIFDSDPLTHDFFRKAGLFPERLLHTPQTLPGDTLSAFIQMDGEELRAHLDEQALHAIEAVIMIEYARCNNMTGDAVIKAFDGKRRTQLSAQDRQAREALAHIRSAEEPGKKK